MNEDIRECCVRCGQRRASVTPESGLCSICIREMFEGAAAPSVARTRFDLIPGVLASKRWVKQ